MSFAGIALQSIKRDSDLQSRILTSSQWVLEGVYKTCLLSLKCLKRDFCLCLLWTLAKDEIWFKTSMKQNISLLPLLKRPSRAVINFCRCSIVVTECDCDLECCRRGWNKHIKSYLDEVWGSVNRCPALDFAAIQSPSKYLWSSYHCDNCPFWSQSWTGRVTQTFCVSISDLSF